MDAVEFSVPRIPLTINRIMRGHWSKRVANKKLWTLELSACISNSGKRALKAWAECKNKVRLEIHVVHSRAFDPDNLVSAAKIPCDAMVTMGFLAGDREQNIELKVTQELAKEKITRFKISRIGA